LAAKGETHKIRWFREGKDSYTGEKTYEYIGGYWEARESGKWEGVLDLY